jgi:hypothetical protein
MTSLTLYSFWDNTGGQAFEVALATANIGARFIVSHCLIFAVTYLTSIRYAATVRAWITCPLFVHLIDLA